MHIMKTSRKVEIVGEINYPGTYPIKLETTISDIIRLAGDFTEKHSSKIYINNKTIVKIPDRELERIL